MESSPISSSVTKHKRVQAITSLDITACEQLPCTVRFDDGSVVAVINNPSLTDDDESEMTGVVNKSRIACIWLMLFITCGCDRCC